MTVFAKENLLRAVTAAIVAGNGDPTDAEVASKLTDVLAALAELIRPPAVSIEAAGIELSADETPGLILAELRKLVKQGDYLAQAACGGSSLRATVASASGLPG